MKRFLIAALLPVSVMAADIERTIDPTDTPSYTMKCTLPATRTDGKAIDASEIQTVEWHRSDDGTTYTQISSEVACEFTEDLTALGDAVYYYRASVTDTGDRGSGLSSDRLVLTLERVAAPNPPTNLTGP